MPWPPRNRLSPPVPRDEEQALLSCCSSRLTSLLCRHHLSFLGMGADLTHPWGPGYGIRTSSPQDSPCHMVTALLRDQDKVLLLIHTFPMGYVQESLVITLSPLGPNGGFQLRHVDFCCFGQFSSSGFFILPSSSPPETDSGD